jgi:hypothetical protein
MKALLAALLVVAAAPDQVVLRDQATGAGLTFTRSADKQAIVETEQWTTGDTKRMTESTYSSSGTLTHRSFTLSRGGAETKVDATIDEGGASLTVTGSRGAATHSHIPLRGKTGLTDPSVTWFVKDKPEKGTSVSFMSFDPEERYWQQVTVTFEGRGKLGKSPEGNLVTRRIARKTIRLLVDDKGLPLVWGDGRLMLTRG